MRLTLLIFLFGLKVFAQATGAAKAADIRWTFDIKSMKDGQLDNASISKKTSIKWVTNVEGARVLQWSALLETPWNLDNDKITTETPGLEIKAKGTKLLVNTSAIKNVIKFESGRELQLTWRSSRPIIVDENCEKLLLAFKPTATEAPMFIGISCSIKNEEVTFNLSYPSDADLSNSSIFEKAGKGDNFRLYDLKKISAAKTKIATFEFLYDGKRYPYTLNSLKAESQGEKNIIASRFVVGAGMASLSLATNTTTYTDSKPLLLFQLLPKDIFGSLNLGFSIESTIGSVKETNSLSYYQAAGYAGYNFKLGDSFQLHPRLYEVISGQDSGSGINYQVNQLGAGLWTKWNISQDLLATFEFVSASAGSQVIKSHSLISAAVFYSGWGVGAQVQDYTVLDANQNVRKFSQTVLTLQKIF